MKKSAFLLIGLFFILGTVSCVVPYEPYEPYERPARNFSAVAGAYVKNGVSRSNCPDGLYQPDTEIYTSSEAIADEDYDSRDGSVERFRQRHEGDRRGPCVKKPQ